MADEQQHDGLPGGYYDALGSDFAPGNEGNDDQFNGPTPEEAQAQAQAAIAQQQPAQQAPQMAGLPPELMQIIQEHGQYQALFNQMQGQQAAQAPQQPQGNPDDLLTMGQFQQMMQAQQTQHRQALDQQRTNMSVQMVSAQYPDYQQQIAKLQDPGLHPFINFAAIQQSANPALAAYTLAKSLATSQEVQQAATAEAAKLAPQLQPQQPQGPRTLNTLPAAAAPATPGKPTGYSDMSPRQIAKLPADQQRALYLKQLQGPVGQQ